MTNYFLGQIGVFGFNFPPRGWASAAGQILPLAQNTALFSLLGTTYGGNGQTTFGLPDLRGRTPTHFDGNMPQGEMTGTETVTLINSEIPGHSHPIRAVSNALADEIPAQSNSVFGKANTGPAPGTAANAYVAGPPNVVLNPLSIGLTGGSQPHNNMQPSLTVNFCIATTGIFPSRN